MTAVPTRTREPGEMASPIVEEAASEKSSTGDHRSYSPFDEGAIDEFDTSGETRGEFQTVGDDDQDGLLFGIEFRSREPTSRAL